jgi:hypothetical protein
MPIVLLLVAAAFAGGGAPAAAQAPGDRASRTEAAPAPDSRTPTRAIRRLPDRDPRVTPLFSRLDRDGDGYLSDAELAVRAGNWIAMDRNGDGRIAPSEFRDLGEFQAAARAVPDEAGMSASNVSR